MPPKAKTLFKAFHNAPEGSRTALYMEFYSYMKSEGISDLDIDYYVEDELSNFSKEELKK